MKPKPPVPEDLSRDEKKRLLAWAEPRYPQKWSWALLQSFIDECLSHWAAKGNPKGYVDWYRAVQNWIVHHYRWRAERAAESPQMSRRERTEEVQSVAQALKGLRVLEGGKGE